MSVAGAIQHHMTERSQAERHLLERIRAGESDAWSQLVERYQGRLLAFARRRAPRRADPEDLVQDTFLLFLRGLAGYRGQASLETYLFLILRRRIIEVLRVRRLGPCELPDGSDDDGSQFAPAAPDQTASWYARQDERNERARAALSAALASLVESLQSDLNFRDLQILELMFYAQWPNRRIAATLGMPAEQIAMARHRRLKALRERIAESPAADLVGSELSDSLLTEIWEEQRPSCPKRSTIGGWVLGTLDEPWPAYVAFHIETVGCSFCRANQEDLRRQTRHDPGALRNRILQSTVGFLRRA